MDDKLEAFAALVEAEQSKGYEARHGTGHPDLRDAASRTTIKPGNRWTKLDVGQSGKYMVDTDGTIYGVKGYGVPHLGHQYGTLDTIQEWDWSGYTAVRVADGLHRHGRFSNGGPHGPEGGRMSAHVYYSEEAKRWPCEGWAGLNKWEAEEGIRRLCRHFKIRQPEINLRGGSVESGRASSSRLTMGVAGGWRLLAHELAHTWHAQRAQASLRQFGGVVRGERWHGKIHRRLVDRLMRYIIKQEWHRAGLAQEAALKEDSGRTGRDERMAAMPSPRALKIQKREAQVKRLRTKVKALTTRLRKAERSLVALRRTVTR